MPRVSIKDSDTTVDVNEGEVLYDSLHDRGIVLPHGCLSGSCGACKVEVIEGSENLAPAGVVEQNTIDAVSEELSLTGRELNKTSAIRLSCRAKVTGDVTIRPIK